VSLPTTSADYSACRKVKVSGQGVYKRVARGDADELIARGWARWMEYGQHVELTEAAPVSTLSQFHSKNGTRPIRADGSGRRAAGQVLGERRSHLEHSPRP
jgi:hypothetical protein